MQDVFEITEENKYYFDYNKNFYGIKLNLNPYQRDTNDCFIRACMAFFQLTDKSWWFYFVSILDTLSNISYNNLCINMEDSCLHKFFMMNAYKFAPLNSTKFDRVIYNRKQKLSKWIKTHKNGKYIVRFKITEHSSHSCYIQNGIIYDTIENLSKIKGDYKVYGYYKAID